jgi:hypothetical protein
MPRSLRYAGLLASLVCSVSVAVAAQPNGEWAENERMKKLVKMRDRQKLSASLTFEDLLEERQYEALLESAGGSSDSAPSISSDVGNASQEEIQRVAAQIVERYIPSEMGTYEGHFLVASRTRSGKTTLIQGAIAAASECHKGLADFHIFDPKGAAWCGLEKDSDHYLFCNNKNRIPQLIERLSILEGVLERRQHQRVAIGGHWGENPPMPIFICVDEFNTLLSLARSYDDQFPSRPTKENPEGNPRTAAKLCSLIERFIFQGAEDRVYIWLMAQTTRVKLLCLDTSVQDNMSYVALARNGDYQSVEDAVSNIYVVSSTSERRRLEKLLAFYRNDKTQNLSIPLAFTTLGGTDLYKLPDLSKARYGALTSISDQAECAELSAPVAVVEPETVQPDYADFDEVKLPPREDAIAYLKSCLSPQYPPELINSFMTYISDPERGGKFLEDGAFHVARIRKNWWQDNGTNGADGFNQFLSYLAQAGWGQIEQQPNGKSIWRFSRQPNGK